MIYAKQDIELGSEITYGAYSESPTLQPYITDMSSRAQIIISLLNRTRFLASAAPQSAVGLSTRLRAMFICRYSSHTLLCHIVCLASPSLVLPCRALSCPITLPVSLRHPSLSFSAFFRHTTAHLYLICNACFIIPPYVRSSNTPRHAVATRALHAPPLDVLVLPSYHRFSWLSYGST